MTEKEHEKKNGAHKDNNLSKVHEIMKDNDLPFYHSTKKEEDDEAQDREQD